MFNHGEMHKAYLGKHANELVQVSSEQVAQIYRERGMVIPVEVSSTLQYLGDNPKSSTADAARDLAVPHQLAAQRIRKLITLKCVNRRADPGDARRTQLILTTKGQRQYALLVRAMQDTAQVYQGLYEEIGCDLPAMLRKAIDALRARPLSERFVETFGDVAGGQRAQS
ncbi:MAG: MarR family transcriptional regulator [Lysobacterales bacterium]